MTVRTDIIAHGHLAATHELYALGWTKKNLARAVAQGDIIRVRQGWYAPSTTADQLQRSIRVGGHLTCVSAARELGLAVREPAQLHIALPKHTSRLRTPSDKSKRLSQNPDATVVTHWTESHPPLNRYVANVRQILHDMVWCQSPEFVVAAADSALRLGLLTETE
jgi:hypothetical protein